MTDSERHRLPIESNQEPMALQPAFMERGVRDVTAFRLDRLTGPPRIVPWPVAVEPQDALTAEDAAFLKACRTRSEPEVTGEAGRAALKLALDILEEMGRNR